jgi:hypothetical protein
MTSPSPTSAIEPRGQFPGSWLLRFVPDVGHVLRRFPHAVGLIVAGTCLQLWAYVDLPSFRIGPGADRYVIADTAIFTGFALILFTVAVALVAEARIVSRGRVRLVVGTATLTALALVLICHHGPLPLARLVALEPWYLAYAALLSVFAAVGVGKSAATATRQRWQSLATLVAAVVVVWIVWCGIDTLVRPPPYRAQEFNPGSLSRPEQALALATMLLLWLAWMPASEPADAPTFTSETLRRIVLPLVMLLLLAFGLMAVAAVVTWRGFGLINGRPDFPLELSIPLLLLTLAGLATAQGDRARLAPMADVLLRYEPLLLIGSGVFHLVALWRQFDPFIDSQTRFHGAGRWVYPQMIYGLAAAASLIAFAGRRQQFSLGWIIGPLAVASLVLAAGPWGVLGFNGLAPEVYQNTSQRDPPLAPASPRHPVKTPAQVELERVTMQQQHEQQRRLQQSITVTLNSSYVLALDSALMLVGPPFTYQYLSDPLVQNWVPTVWKSAGVFYALERSFDQPNSLTVRTTTGLTATYDLSTLIDQAPSIEPTSGPNRRVVLDRAPIFEPASGSTLKARLLLTDLRAGIYQRRIDHLASRLTLLFALEADMPRASGP